MFFSNISLASPENCSTLLSREKRTYTTRQQIHCTEHLHFYGHFQGISPISNKPLWKLHLTYYFDAQNKTTFSIAQAPSVMLRRTPAMPSSVAAATHSGWAASTHSGWAASTHSGWAASTYSGWAASTHSNWAASTHSGWAAATHSGWAATVVAALPLGGVGRGGHNPHRWGGHRLERQKIASLLPQVTVYVLSKFCHNMLTCSFS
jgi:hypothetical protein